jgi:hypothetical protein
MTIVLLSFKKHILTETNLKRTYYATVTPHDKRLIQLAVPAFRIDDSSIVFPIESYTTIRTYPYAVAKMTQISNGVVPNYICFLAPHTIYFAVCDALETRLIGATHFVMNIWLL